MKKLYVGRDISITLPKGGFLFIDDELPEMSKARMAKANIFDPRFDSFNPLKNIDYKKAREIADVLYTVYPQGENTLTVRNGRRALFRALLKAKRLDKVQGDEEVMGLVGDILASPILEKALCNPTNSTLKPTAMILARLNRAELGEFDALVLGLLLIASYQGQIVVPDGGFYLRAAHTALLREDRLIAGVNHLGELPDELRQAMLLVPDKEARGALYEDAKALALYEGHWPDTDGYTGFVQKAMG